VFKTFKKIFAFCDQKKQKLFLFSFVFYLFLLFFSIKKVHKQKKIFLKNTKKKKKVQKKHNKNGHKNTHVNSQKN
jgi:hypothetical protein